MTLGESRSLFDKRSYAQDTAPTDAREGNLWIDTSQNPPETKVADNAGNWNQVAQIDYDWTLDQSGTASLATGAQTANLAPNALYDEYRLLGTATETAAGAGTCQLVLNQAGDSRNDQYRSYRFDGSTASNFARQVNFGNIGANQSGQYHLHFDGRWAGTCTVRNVKPVGYANLDDIAEVGPNRPNNLQSFRLQAAGTAIDYTYALFGRDQ